MNTGVQASGFDYPDGTVVYATFGSDAPQNASDTIEDGAFTFSFDQPSESCNLGSTIEEPAAFYVDANGDGTCTLGDDYVFVWLAYGGPGYGPGTPSALGFPISPNSERCPTLSSMSPDRVVDAVRRLCPEIGDCIPFCAPAVPGQPQAGNLGCPAADAGVVDGGQNDAGLLDASPLDAGQ